MILTFVRHAEATADEPSDFDRKLTETGKQQARQLAKFFTSFQFPPRLILSSPVIRARLTAEIIKEGLESAVLDEQTWLACGMTPEVCVHKVQGFTRFGSILLVGHEPDLSNSIAFLLGCQNWENLNVRKAGICALEIRSFSLGGAILQYFIPPNFFRLSCL